METPNIIPIIDGWSKSYIPHQKALKITHTNGITLIIKKSKSIFSSDSHITFTGYNIMFIVPNALIPLSQKPSFIKNRQELKQIPCKTIQHLREDSNEKSINLMNGVPTIILKKVLDVLYKVIPITLPEEVKKVITNVDKELLTFKTVKQRFSNIDVTKIHSSFLDEINSRTSPKLSKKVIQPLTDEEEKEWEMIETNIPSLKTLPPSLHYPVTGTPQEEKEWELI